MRLLWPTLEQTMPEETTNFGFKKIPIGEKVDQVARVFHSVAGRYDLMNDVMSVGTHRLMKKIAVEMTAVRRGHQVLDLAAGTGDLAALMSPIVGPEGCVVLCDINQSMLEQGRERLLNDGMVGNLEYVQADAENLPYPDNTFDRITISFGLRNVTRKEEALKSMLRVLKPKGRLIVLEFSRPENQFLAGAYRTYSSLWPKVGKIITGDADSYQYLHESIQVHPSQRELLDMLEGVGYKNCRYHNLLGGVAAIHVGRKA